MSEKVELFEKSANLVKIHGILSIIFGSIGTITGLFFAGLFAISMASTYDEADRIGFLILSILTLIFWLIPHVYLVIAGVVLLREPEPKVAKTLTIINLIVGVFWNYILLIFSIISLVQLGDYDKGYHHRKRQHS